MAKGNRTKHRRKRGGGDQDVPEGGPMVPMSSTPGSTMESRLNNVELRLKTLEDKVPVNLPNLAGAPKLAGGGIPEALDQYLGLKGGQRLGWSIEGELPSEIAFGGSRRRRYKRTGKRGRRTGKRGGDALSDALKKSGGVT
jgi:hypothetical protein